VKPLRILLAAAGLALIFVAGGSLQSTLQETFAGQAPKISLDMDPIGKHVCRYHEYGGDRDGR